MVETSEESGSVRRIDAIRAARYHRQAARLLIVLLVLQITSHIVMTNFGELAGLAAIAALIVSGALAVVTVVRTLAAIRASTTGIVIAGMFAFLPVANLFALLAVCAFAITELQQVGIRTGFFGTRNTEIEPLSKLLGCPGCGYSLYGNTSGRCPECGWDVPRAKKPVPLADPVCQKCGYNLTNVSGDRCPRCGRIPT